MNMKNVMEARKMNGNVKVRVGQDRRSSGHFIAFGKKCYLFYCSCDAFTLFLKDFQSLNDITEADIARIASKLAEYEDYVKSVEDYDEFIEELQNIAMSLHIEAELVDVEEEFEDVEVVYFSGISNNGGGLP